ncbi:hypothetical protein, partial [Nocardia sp. SC052]|uniref:hypothetical protein n=1 Tax=Nocardia sichangensis TaxID=3385975 RepID=UPI0039A1F275
MLPLRRGDSIVVNGTIRTSKAASVARGTVDPHQLQRCFDAGADIHLHPWLHAKLIADELVGNLHVTVIGSANVSQHSERNLEEGTAVLYDVQAFETVHSAVFKWIDEAA